jgi:hypothetical protein
LDDPGETKNRYVGEPAVVARPLAQLARSEKNGRSRP